jgi:hypothetical protein
MALDRSSNLASISSDFDGGRKSRQAEIVGFLPCSSFIELPFSLNGLQTGQLRNNEKRDRFTEQKEGK